MMTRFAMTATMAIGAILVLAAGVQAADAPTTKPAEYVIGPMHVQTLKPMVYLYASGRATLDTMPQSVEQLMGKVGKVLQSGTVKPSSGPVFIYFGVEQDHSKPFELQLGYPVDDGVQGADDVKVRKTEAFHCATVLYTGPIAHIGKAFGALMPQIFKAGLMPTGEMREAYLYWEGPESPNNVVQIQVGIQP